jgi:hypothetical protein
VVITDIHTEWPISNSTVSSLLDDGGKGFVSWQGQETLSFLRKSILVVPIQPLIQWVPASFFFARDKLVVRPTTHSHLVEQLRMRGAVPPVAPCVYVLVLKKRDEALRFSKTSVTTHPASQRRITHTDYSAVPL